MQIKDGKIIIGNKRSWLLAAELHYFRMSPENWEDRLDKLVSSGCNAVAFYIPWFIHEPQEGLLDFTGELDSRNNLVCWLELIKKKKLIAIVRPGPYVYTEMTNSGIPHWILTKYPESRAVKWTGTKFDWEFFPPQNLSYLHPVFLQKVNTWFKAVCKVIVPYQSSRGGPIHFVQADNEVPGMHIWMGAKDANPQTMGMGKEDGFYPAYLKGLYETVGHLNGVYKTNFNHFSDVTLPSFVSSVTDTAAFIDVKAEETRSQGEIARNSDWDNFYFEHYLPQYFKVLIESLKKHGIDSHLIANAGNPNNMLYLAESKKKNPELLLGVDNYYALMNTLDSRSSSYFLDYGAEITRVFGGKPVISWEFQCGYWHDYPPVYGPCLSIWLRWALITGYDGLNFYLFAGGENRHGSGHFGSYHEYQAPISTSGDLREHYFEIKNAITDIKSHEAWLLDSEKVHDIALGVSKRQALKDIIHVLFMANVSYQVYDLDGSSVQELLANKCLWVNSGKQMDLVLQDKLLEYAASGGNLILCGDIPETDSQGANAISLKKNLHLTVKPLLKKECQIILDGKEVYIESDSRKVEMEGEILATTLAGLPAIVKKTWGRGSVTVLPFNIKFKFRSQLDIVHTILSRVGVKSVIKAEKLHGLLRKDSNNQEKAFFLNYHPIPLKETVSIRGKSRIIELPAFQIAVLD